LFATGTDTYKQGVFCGGAPPLLCVRLQREKTMQSYDKRLFYDTILLGYVSKITKAHFHRLNLHIFVKKPRSSTAASAFFASICKLIWQNCIFQTLETHPKQVCLFCSFLFANAGFAGGIPAHMSNG